MNNETDNERVIDAILNDNQESENDDFSSLLDNYENDRIKNDLYSLFGATVTPSMEASNPYLSALAKTAQEGIANPTLDYLNQRAFNLPRAIAKQGGYDWPQSQTLPGTILQKGAGVLGAAQSAIPMASNLSRILSLGAKKVIPQIASSRAKRNILSSMIGGTLTGAAYTPTEDVVGFPQRGLQATVGGLAGAGSGAVGEGMRTVNKWIHSGRGPALLRKLKTDSSLKYQKNQMDIKSRIAPEIENASKSISPVIDDMTRTTRDLSTRLQQASEKDALSVQSRLPQFFRNNGEAYANKLDNVLDIFSQSQGDMLRGEADDILSSAIEFAKNEGIDSSPIYSKLASLRSKYGGINNETTFADDPIVLRDFIREVRGVRNAISDSTRRGNKRFSNEERLGLMLYKSLGDWLDPLVGGSFSELNKAYSPVIRGMNLANSIFKPYKGEYEIGSGASFLKKLALGKGDSGKAKLLKDLQSGMGFGEGIGNLSQETMNLGGELSTASNALKSAINTGGKIPKEIRGKYANELNSLKKQRMVRQNQLAERELSYSQKASLKRNLQQLGRTLMYTGMGVGAGGGIFNLMARNRGGYEQ